jgi:hypothetical protein
MASRKPRKSESVSHRGSISDHASDWIRRFSKELEDNFIDAAVSVPADAAAREYQHATIRAVFSVLLDSGMDTESFAEMVGRVLIEKRTASVEWTAEFNQRRFELIDKEIQETLTPAERIELAGLTGIMRERLELEADLPMEGAKALHRKLLALAAEGKPR